MLKRFDTKLLLIGLAVIAVLAMAVVAWLAIKAADTASRQAALIPSTQVVIEHPAPQEPQASGLEETPPAAPPASTDKLEPPPAPSAPPQVPPVPPLKKGALTPAPQPDLTEATPQGSLPKIASDGRAPWQVYARPFDQTDKHPRIAILMTELGPSSSAAETAIQNLPGDVSLAFLSFANNISNLFDLARAAGHEVLLDMPMEPDTFPQDDPGPEALLTNLSTQETTRRLNDALTRSNGYIGIVNFMGSRFTANNEHLRPILKILHDRGLMIVDTKTNPQSQVPTLAKQMGLPFVTADERIDGSASRAAIDQSLVHLEEIAKQKGIAVGYGTPYPVTFERLNAWIPTLAAKGITLVPISAAGLTAKTP